MSGSKQARVALVTGAAQGIGRSIALRLASDGLDVAVNDVAAKASLLEGVVRDIKGKGRRATAVPADVTKEDEVKIMVQVVVRDLGKLDVMVANAGIAWVETIMDANIEQWQRVWAVNILGVLLCYKYAAIQMVKQGSGGRIIGASSILGNRGRSLMGSYSASKFAVRSLTETAAGELREHNITVNAYAPGFIDTPLAALRDDKPLGEATAGLKKKLNMSWAKTASPETVATIVSYLASPESAFITGETISIDGGAHLGPPVKL